MVIFYKVTKNKTRGKYEALQAYHQGSQHLLSQSDRDKWFKDLEISKLTLYSQKGKMVLVHLKRNFGCSKANRI